MKLISIYESENKVRTATVYEDYVDGYKVVFNDRKERILEKVNYKTLEEAENLAEDWAMYE